MKNYYSILGVSVYATDEEIKTAYRKLAKKYHPDIVGTSREANRVMADINEAFSVLSDSKKRMLYDYDCRQQGVNFSYTSPKENTDDEPHKESDSTDSGTVEDTHAQTNKNQDSSKTNTDENTQSEKGPEQDSILKRVLKGFYDNFRTEAKAYAKEKEEAYRFGMDLSEWELIYVYKRSKGAKRRGYLKALEKRGLMEWNSNDGYCKTSKFKEYE